MALSLLASHPSAMLLGTFGSALCTFTLRISTVYPPFCSAYRAHCPDVSGCLHERPWTSRRRICSGEIVRTGTCVLSFSQDGWMDSSTLSTANARF